MFRSVFLVVSLFFSHIAVAAPFLVSDPYGTGDLQPTAFQVTVNGKADRVVPVKHPDGGVYLRYDMKNLDDGVHVLKVKAFNEAWQTESAEMEYRVKKTGDAWSPVAKEEEKMSPSRTYRGHRGQ